MGKLIETLEDSPLEELVGNLIMACEPSMFTEGERDVLKTVNRFPDLNPTQDEIAAHLLANGYILDDGEEPDGDDKGWAGEWATELFTELQRLKA